MYIKSKFEIGIKLREIRKKNGFTINYVAKKTNFTPSFISQLERGLTRASIASLQKITKVLGISMSNFFSDEGENNAKNHEEDIKVIREKNRKKITYPDQLSKDYFLTGLNGQFGVTYSEIESNMGSGGLFSHGPGEECIIVLEGQLDITIDKHNYKLYKGDSITFLSKAPHGWKNTGSITAKLIWVTSPPNY